MIQNMIQRGKDEERGFTYLYVFFSFSSTTIFFLFSYLTEHSLSTYLSKVLLAKRDATETWEIIYPQ